MKIAEIATIVAKVYNITEHDLTGRCKYTALQFARITAAQIMREEGFKEAAIQQYFFFHTPKTVSYHFVKHFNKYIKSEPLFKQNYLKVVSAIEGELDKMETLKLFLKQ